MLLEVNSIVEPERYRTACRKSFPIANCQFPIETLSLSPSGAC